MHILAGGESEGPSNLILSLVIKFSPFYPHMTEALRFHELQELKSKILQLLLGAFRSTWDHPVSVGFVTAMEAILVSTQIFHSLFCFMIF